MNKFKVACVIISLSFSLAIFGGLMNQQQVAAQSGNQDSPSEEKLELTVKYPSRSGSSDTVFDFAVEIKYSGGDEPLLFDLSAEGPEGWAVRIQQSAMESKEIAAIRLDPTKSYPDTITVVTMAPFWLYPEPGDYTIKLKAAAGEIEDSITLTAVITARYGFTVETKTERLNIKATAGKESPLTIIVTNTGTAILDKITFSSSEPRGIHNEEWSITYTPEEITSLSPGHEQEVDVTIKPPSKTIAGDYMTTLKFFSDPSSLQAPPELDIRVTVSTSTKWGWIGAGIVVATIVGLYFAFRRFGRR